VRNWFFKVCFSKFSSQLVPLYATVRRVAKGQYHPFSTDKVWDTVSDEAKVGAVQVEST
jgi:hypothetical protein